MTVGIAGTNLAVLAVDETLGMLIPGNLPCDGSGLLLGAGASGCSGVTGSLNLPATLGMRGDVLVLSHSLTSKSGQRTPWWCTRMQCILPFHP